VDSGCILQKSTGGHFVLKKTVAGSEGSKAKQRLLDIAAQADAAEGIRQGLEDVKKGRVQTAREFFAEFEAEHGLFVSIRVRAERDRALCTNKSAPGNRLGQEMVSRTHGCHLEP
jgi:hypothetical protein